MMTLQRVETCSPLTINDEFDVCCFYLSIFRSGLVSFVGIETGCGIKQTCNYHSIIICRKYFKF